MFIPTETYSENMKVIQTEGYVTFRVLHSQSVYVLILNYNLPWRDFDFVFQEMLPAMESLGITGPRKAIIEIEVEDF